MRSMYRRQLLMMVSIIVLSFTMLSTAFMLLSYRYMIQDEQADASRNAGYIATTLTATPSDCSMPSDSITMLCFRDGTTPPHSIG